MKKLVALLTTVSLLSGAVALAGPPKDKKADKKAKVTDVWTCPMTGEKIKDHKGVGMVVVGDKKVHFCCAGCPESFAKLSDKEKKAKVAEAVKKDKAAPKSEAKKG